MSTWDPSKHPRVPAGSPEGGQFVGFNRAPALRREWDDNPGGSWLEHERQLAEQRAREGRLVSGSPTAGWSGRLPAATVSKLPGLMGEHKLDLLRDVKASAIADSVRREGVKRPVFINVNHRGEAYINEGNHRAALAAAAGHLTVPVEFRYYAGGETVPGRWNVKSLKEKMATARAGILKVTRAARGSK